MSAKPLVPNKIGDLKYPFVSNVEDGITAHAGGGQASAYQLTAQMSLVSVVGSANDSVKLPKIVASPGLLGSVGSLMFLQNQDASDALKVYGGLLDTINGVASATGNAVSAGAMVLLVATSFDPDTGVGTWSMINTTSSAVAAITSGTISGVTIDSSVIGGGTPAAGTFTALTANSIAGGDSSLDITGLAAAQGGSVTQTGGTSSTSGNAGGASAITGGTPGATGVGGAANVTGGAGGATSGKGGAANITGGAGTNGNASGGSVILKGGAKNGSGLDGGVINRGTFQGFKQGAPAAKTTTVTLTAAEVVGGLITANQGGAGAANYTFPLGTDLDAALPTDFTTDDAMLFRAVNISTVAAEDVTFLGNTGTTLVGSGAMASNAAATDLSFATFLIRKTGSGTFSIYRVG